MKFKWNLQKVLDIRGKQEQALKAELFEITQRQINLKQKVLIYQMRIKTMASEMKSEKMDVLGRKEFLNYAFDIEQKINALKVEIDKTEEQKQKKIQENVQMRKARKVLEILREKAFEDFMQNLKKKEQDFLDDITSVRVVRQKMGLI